MACDPVAPAACKQGNINLIDAAVRHGVKKFVLVTSIGTGELRRRVGVGQACLLYTYNSQRSKIGCDWMQATAKMHHPRTCTMC